MRSRVRSGRWQRLQRGVYASLLRGARPGRRSLWAALLRAGPGAVLSHQTAAERHGLIDEPSSAHHHHGPGCRGHPARAKIPGVVIHRSDAILRTRHPAMLPPCTRVEDTVLDLIQIAPTFDDAYAWICRAVGRRRTTADRIHQAMDARKKMRWRRELVVALGDAGEWRLVGARIPLRSPGGTPARAPRRSSPGEDQPAHWQQVPRQPLRGVRGRARRLDGTAAHPADEQWRDKRRDNANAVRRHRHAQIRPCSTWAIADARPRPMSPPYCACAAGRAMRTPAPARPAPCGMQFHDRDQFWALIAPQTAHDHE